MHLQHFLFEIVCLDVCSMCSRKSRIVNRAGSVLECDVVCPTRILGKKYAA